MHGGNSNHSETHWLCSSVMMTSVYLFKIFSHPKFWCLGLGNLYTNKNSAANKWDNSFDYYIFRVTIEYITEYQRTRPCPERRSHASKYVWCNFDRAPAVNDVNNKGVSK